MFISPLQLKVRQIHCFSFNFKLHVNAVHFGEGLVRNIFNFFFLISQPVFIHTFFFIHSWIPLSVFYFLKYLILDVWKNAALLVIFCSEWLGLLAGRVFYHPSPRRWFISPLALIKAARRSCASSRGSNIGPGHNQGCWMLLIWGRGNVEALKCLMGGWAGFKGQGH